MAKKKTQAKRGRGRPKTKVADRIKKRLRARGAAKKIVRNAAKAGLTDKQTADVLGVSVRTLHAWKADPEFASLLKKGKEESDRSVEDSLFVRASGYSIREVTTERADDGNLVVTKVVEKHVPADTTAQIFWLKNRKPADWKDRREITGADGKPLLEGIEVTVVNGTQA